MRGDEVAVTRSRRIFTWQASLAVTVALIMLAAAPAGAARARKGASRAPRAAARETPPAVPLSQIRVLGDRPAPFALDARAAELIDVKTAAVLYAYNEHEKMQPASLAKIMTFYLTLDALKAGRIALNTPVTISEGAWRLSMDQSVSHMFLRVGQTVTVHDLLYGLMVSSGNDAAVALAQYEAGSTEAFTQQMNEKAKQLGLSETHFVNPDGLPVEGEYTTAADMVKLGRSLIQHHPEALTYTAAKEFTFNNITQRNFNTLLFYDSHVTGIKTGHVQEAGFHLVASAEAGGMTLVSAVMGTPSMEKRRVETKKLLDWAFRTFETYQPETRGLVPATVAVYGGVADSVALAPAHDIWITLGRGENKRVNVSYAPAAKYLVAPVAKGTQVGAIAVTLDQKPYASIPVVTATAVKQGGLFKRLKDRIRRAL
jgi:serine-type D-Ala-D-Ala carboxypeptidase (penicillin-binding protein 5/6)